MTLLHLDSSPLAGASASRQLTAAIVAAAQEANPDLAVVYRDLAAAPPAHLGGDALAPRALPPVVEGAATFPLIKDMANFVEPFLPPGFRTRLQNRGGDSAPVPSPAGSGSPTDAPVQAPAAPGAPASPAAPDTK